MYSKRLSAIKRAIPSIVLGEELRFDCPNDYEKYWEENAFPMRMLFGRSNDPFNALIYSWQSFGLPVSIMSASESMAEKKENVVTNESLLILPINFRGDYVTDLGPIRLDDQLTSAFIPSDTLLRGKESGTALLMSLDSTKLKDTLTCIGGNDPESSNVLMEKPISLNTQNHTTQFLYVIKNLCDTAALFKDKSFAIRKLGLDDTVYRLAAHMILDGRGPTVKSISQDQFSLKMLKGVLDWVMANLGESITLTKLERISGLSARSLQLMFARHLNTSPMSWVKEQRIQKAHQMLIHQPDLHVSEIANLCGYPSSEFFSARYRQRFGQTPRQAKR